ncbi:MAG: hypothetical protein Q8L48_11060 [Archangium sp.]|nr:hypothetical protein [Archangium sp.]
MRRALPLVLVVVAAARSEAPPPTLAARKLVAERLAAKFGPVKMPTTPKADDCFEYRPPAALGCSTTAFICPRGSGSATCSGSFSEQRGVVLYDHLPASDEADPMPALVLTSESGDECPECECGRHTSGFSIAPGTSPAEEKRFRERMRKEASARYAICLTETAARQRRERVVRTCQLLLVDPCRKEAFLRCTGRNGSVESGDPPMGKTLHFSFAQPLDGGVPRGGEWQLGE